MPRSIDRRQPLEEDCFDKYWTYTQIYGVLLMSRYCTTKDILVKALPFTGVRYH